MSHRLALRTSVAVAATALALASAHAAVAAPSAAVSPVVTVDLTEMRIELDRAVAPAGEVRFAVTNSGAETHELVVLLTSLPAGELPPDPEEAGKIVEDLHIGETGDMAPGATSELVLTLAAGRYVLVCDEPGHYAAGMRLAFTVTAPAVEVDLDEMTIVPDRASVLAGPVTFVVRNRGEATHELVLLRTDLPQDRIPAYPIERGDRTIAGEDGTVDEEANFAETGDIDPGRVAVMSVTLPPGKYVLICNEVGHYAAGMHLAFTAVPPPPLPASQLAGGGD